MTNLTIIVPAAAAAVPERIREADKGGEQHGLREAVARLVGYVPKDTEQLDKKLAETIAQLQEVIGKIEKSSVGSMQLKSVEVGLAISAEGSIGIVTAGVETSITLSFERA